MIRLWFINSCGIWLNPMEIKFHTNFAFLKHKSKCDIVRLCETNFNWKKSKGRASLNSRIREFWQTFRASLCNNEHEDVGLHEGGCCMFALDQISHRCSQTGKDTRKLGRWIWMEFTGKKDHKVRIVTAYRPCRNIIKVKKQQYGINTIDILYKKE